MPSNDLNNSEKQQQQCYGENGTQTDKDMLRIQRHKALPTMRCTRGSNNWSTTVEQQTTLANTLDSETENNPVSY